MQLPKNPRCEVYSHLTDIRSIINLMKTNKAEADHVAQCITEILTPLDLIIPVSAILKFPNLVLIRPPILIENQDQLMSFLSLNKLRSAIFYLAIPGPPAPLILKFWSNFNLKHPDTEYSFFFGYGRYERVQFGPDYLNIDIGPEYSVDSDGRWMSQIMADYTDLTVYFITLPNLSRRPIKLFVNSSVLEFLFDFIITLIGVLPPNLKFETIETDVGISHVLHYFKDVKVWASPQHKVVFDDILNVPGHYPSLIRFIVPVSLRRLAEYRHEYPNLKVLGGYCDEPNLDFAREILYRWNLDFLELYTSKNLVSDDSRIIIRSKKELEYRDSDKFTLWPR